MQQCWVARRFAVKGETITVMTDVMNALDPVDELQRQGRIDPLQRRGLKRRFQRIQGEQMLDVGQQQLLMLLLVVQAQGDPPQQLRVVTARE